MTDSKIANFTGPRTGATVLDQQQLVEFFEKYKVKAQTGDIHAVAMIIGTVK